jgi:hypothetical protein
LLLFSNTRAFLRDHLQQSLFHPSANAEFSIFQVGIFKLPPWNFKLPRLEF